MTRFFFVRLAAIASVGVLCGMPMVVNGQGVAPESKPTPLAANGHPDLNGTWDNGRSEFGFATPVDPKGSICVWACGPGWLPPDGGGRDSVAQGADRPTYKAEFLAKVKDLNDRQVQEDPTLRCMPPGVPRIGPPDKIVQTPSQVVFLYDDLSGSFFRIIPIDGRPHRTDVDPSYLGDSIGRWDGDTLVVEANQFNDETWLVDNGAFHTGKLRVVERLLRVGDVIQYQATAEDTVLATPWVMKPRTLRLTTEEIFEPSPCVEHSLQHATDLSHHTNGR